MFLDFGKDESSGAETMRTENVAIINHKIKESILKRISQKIQQLESTLR